MPDGPVPIERPAVVRVGKWVVYPRLCRATRAGDPVHLRSQVIDLLVVLARRPNDLVSKQEVTAALWPGVHVSGSALSRCMAELRQVFDDDASNPWLIETIAKRGYRLIAPVVIEEHGPSDGDAEPKAPDQEVGTSVAPLEDITDPRPSLRRRIPVAAWTTLAVLVVGGIVAIGWAVARSRQPVVGLSGHEKIVLADVVNSTGDKSFDGAIRLALAVQLEQAPFLRVISDERVRETLTLMRKGTGEPVVGAIALEVCRREGGAVVLAGSIARLGRRFAVGVEAIECREGESVARVIEQADSADQVLGAVGRVASAVRARLGESQASLQANDVPVARATTTSLDALRALSLGDRKRDDGHLAEALDDYRQATAIDSQFAVAWARQGVILTGIGTVQEASDAFTTAFRLASRTSLPERYYITAHYHQTVTGRIDLATEALQSWKRLYPGSAIASTNLAGMYAGEFGRYEDALDELRQAGPLMPTGVGIAWLRTTSLAALGHFAEAKQTLADSRFEGEYDPSASLLRVRIAWVEGDAATQRAEFDRAASRGGESAYTMLEERAAIAMIEGRCVEGRRLYDEALALAVSVGDARAVATTHLTHALAEAAVGHASEARRAAAAGLQALRDRDTYLRAAMALALTGDRLEAKRAFDLGTGAATFNARGDALWIPTVGAEVDGIERPAAGLSRLDAVRPFERGAAFLLIPLAVRAHLLQRAGRAQESVAACREFIRLRGVNLTSSLSPLIQVTLARALAASGDMAGSRTAYASFLDSWRGADADVPLLRAARVEYARTGQ